MQGPHLKAMLLAGLKWATTRGTWKLSTIRQFKKSCENQSAVRLQSGRAFSSLIAYAVIKHISEPGHPDNLITPAYLREAGCSHMTKAEYILQYCSKKIRDPSDESKLIDVTIPLVVCVIFGAMWNRHGDVIERKL